MNYIILCQDAPNQAEARARVFDEHKAYVSSGAMNCLISGPCIDDQNRHQATGSFFLVEADSLAQVTAWNRNDPFHQAGVWQSVEIHAIDMRNNQFTTPPQG